MKWHPSGIFLLCVGIFDFVFGVVRINQGKEGLGFMFVVAGVICVGTSVFFARKRYQNNY
jgi:hypothetical protein